MKQTEYISSLLKYLHASSTAFHAVSAAQKILEKNSFTRLYESDPWNVLPDGKYYVTRNDSSMIAFTRDSSCKPLSIAGAHVDSPGLKTKPRPVIEKHNYLQLGVEVYGGALLHPWFDRELSLAGRVCCYEKKNNKKTKTLLVDFQRAIGIIPSLAIHLNREANKGHEINKQTELAPILGLTDDFTDGFHAQLLRQLQIQYPDIVDLEIIDFELFLYDATRACETGLNREFITGGRLDNLLSCYASVQGLVTADQPENSMIILNDHEEVGSVSTSGAQGSFVHDILSRLYENTEERLQVLRDSFFISADNAHAVHPNFSYKHDSKHLPLMNGGIVIKYNANQRYATNAETAARFRLLCELADVPVQEFVMRSDMACGSTIGPMTSANLGIDTVDIGIPTLAMHSLRETAAQSDCWYLYRILQKYFSHK